MSRDGVTDVAIIRIRDARDLPTVKLGDSSKLAVGDDVLAIGNALDLVGGPTVTRGIVSALNRSLPSENGSGEFSHLIQTDAAINNGNSGGPLVNAAGEVVGINTVVIQATGSGNLVQNIGFAISIDAVKPNLEALKSGKAPSNPTTFLGATLATVTPAIKERLDLTADEGVLVNEVVPGSPAENGGLQPGDVIVKFDGKDVKEAREIVDSVQSHKSGEKVTIEYFRGKDKRTATVTLGSRQMNRRVVSKVMSTTPDALEEAPQPPRGHVRIVYLGPVAPHWDLQSDFGDRALIEEFRQRALARLVLLPPHDPQFRRNRERVARDAERENLLLDWDLGIPDFDEEER